MKLWLSVFIILVSLFLYTLDNFDNLKNSSRRPANNISEQNRGWKITLFDNFSPANVAAQEAQNHDLPFDLSCYTQKAPICEYPFWNKRTCDNWQGNDPLSKQNLADLNKCRWRIYNKYNWMDFDIPEGEGVNSFHESQVAVQNGFLRLKANKNPRWPLNKSCKDPMHEGPYTNYSIDCPIISGGIESMPWGLHDQAEDKWEFGFEQAYGRWEIRAKLPDGPGIWPGLWMLPMWENPNPDPVENTGGRQDCGWPHNGEFDLLETWSDAPNEAHQGYIHGNCGKDLDVRGGENTKGLDLVNQFHTYGMEWAQNYIKFYVDDKVTTTIWKGDKMRSKYRSSPNKDKMKRPKEEAWIPSYPFHWILNLSIEGMKDDSKLVPKYETWNEKEVVIDYVKVYRRCTQEEFEADEQRDVNEKQCQQFATDNEGTGADAYQSTKGETASASMMAYPNPYKMGHGEINVEFKLDQDCNDVKIDLINILGQIINPGDVNLVKEDSDINPDSHYFHNGPLRGNKQDHNLIYQLSFTPHPDMAAAMYMVRAEFRECAIPGAGYTGHGNYVWKQIIIK